jgi:hypothetical protein
VSRVRRDVVVLVASLAVFAACALVVADGRVGPVERAVFDAVNQLPDWLYGPMLLFQYLGVLAMPLVVAVGALAWRRWRLAGALVLVVPLKLALERVAKLLVERERPGTTVPDAILRGGAQRRAELHLWACHHHLRHRRAAGAGVAAPLGHPRLRAGHLQCGRAGVPGSAQPAGCGRRSGDRPGHRRRIGSGL